MKQVLMIFSLNFLFLLPSFAEGPLHIDFYGIFSTSAVDKTMVDMTKNLYFTQLQEMNNVTVTDKSNSLTVPEQENPANLFDPAATGGTSKTGIAFFAEIKVQNTTWTCVLNAENMETGKKVSVAKEYNSYYKILTEAKESIEDILSKFAADSTEVDKKATTGQRDSFQPQVSTESIAGTWYGEDYIDKIIILRGGRGFIIYKNGASMNINVSVKNLAGGETLITIIQAGKSNASFFPELPRDVALENAPAAAPVEWTLTLTGTDTMSGSKKTLIADSSSPSGVRTGTTSVSWERR